MENQTRITVVVDRTLHRKAKVKAALTGKPMAEVMREALEKWVGQGNPPEEEEPPEKKP